jgi:uncharacterized protein (TIGR00251 family)
MPGIHETADGLLLDIVVQTRASRDEILGPHGERIKIRITAPPVDGKANQHLLRFLARAFGVSRQAVSLVNGASSRYKRIHITSPQKIPPGLGM